MELRRLGDGKCYLSHCKIDIEHEVELRGLGEGKRYQVLRRCKTDIEDEVELRGVGGGLRRSLAGCQELLLWRGGEGEKTKNTKECLTPSFIRMRRRRSP